MILVISSNLIGQIQAWKQNPWSKNYLQIVKILYGKEPAKSRLDSVCFFRPGGTHTSSSTPRYVIRYVLFIFYIYKSVYRTHDLRLVFFKYVYFYFSGRKTHIYILYRDIGNRKSGRRVGRNKEKSGRSAGGVQRQGDRQHIIRSCRTYPTEHCSATEGDDGARAGPSRQHPQSRHGLRSGPVTDGQRSQLSVFVLRKGKKPLFGWPGGAFFGLQIINLRTLLDSTESSAAAASPPSPPRLRRRLAFARSLHPSQFFPVSCEPCFVIRRAAVSTCFPPAWVRPQLGQQAHRKEGVRCYRQWQ